MIDSESVAVGGEVPPGPTDRLVVAKARRQGEKAQCDTHADPGEGAPAVALQGELALAGPKDRLDPLAHRPQGAVSAPLPLAIGAHQARPEAGRVGLELGPGKALVGDHGVARELGP